MSRRRSWIRRLSTGEKLVLGAVAVGLTLAFLTGEATGAALALPWRQLYDEWEQAYTAVRGLMVSFQSDAAQAKRELTDVSQGIYKGAALGIEGAFEAWRAVWDPLGFWNPSTGHFEYAPVVEGSAGTATTTEEAH